MFPNHFDLGWVRRSEQQDGTSTQSYIYLKAFYLKA